MKILEVFKPIGGILAMVAGLMIVIEGGITNVSSWIPGFGSVENLIFCFLMIAIGFIAIIGGFLALFFDRRGDWIVFAVGGLGWLLGVTGVLHLMGNFPVFTELSLLCRAGACVEFLNVPLEIYLILLAGVILVLSLNQGE